MYSKSLVCISNRANFKDGISGPDVTAGESASVEEVICHWLTKAELEIAESVYSIGMEQKPIYVDGESFERQGKQLKNLKSRDHFGVYDEKFKKIGELKIRISTSGRATQSEIKFNDGISPQRKPLFGATIALDKIPYRSASNLPQWVQAMMGFNLPFGDENLHYSFLNKDREGEKFYVNTQHNNDFRSLAFPFGASPETGIAHVLLECGDKAVIVKRLRPYPFCEISFK